MNAIAEQTTMSHKLTPAKQNEILSRCQWTPEGKVRVQSTYRSDPLLRAAGVRHPRPLEIYPVNVRRDSSGFLVIDHQTHTPQTESDSELFQAGGLLAGLVPEEKTPYPPASAENAFGRAEVKELVRDIKAGIAQRRFEIPTGSHSKIRVYVVALDDRAQSSPLEHELWEPREARDAEIHAAISALHMARELAHYEH